MSFAHPVYRAGFALCVSSHGVPRRGGPRHEISCHLPFADAHRRRPKTVAHRLHGVEGSRQRARPAPHFQAPLEGPSAGRLSRAVEEGRKAGLRLMGRIRAEFRRTPHSFRTRQHRAGVGENASRTAFYPDFCDLAGRSVFARNRSERRAAHRRGFRSLVGSDHASHRGSRGRWTPSARPRNESRRFRARRAGRKSDEALLRCGLRQHRLRRNESLSAARRDSHRESGGGRFELGWKSARGSADSRRIDDSTPFFAEMATPGTSFEGRWQERAAGDREALFAAANKYAAEQIARHKKYAQ